MTDDQPFAEPFAEYGARPVPVEDVIDALVDAGVLAERQATVYVLREIEATPRGAVADELGIAESTVDSTLQRATEKVESARQTLDIIDAARNRPLPTECAACGATLGGRWSSRTVADDGGREVEEALCLDCAALSDVEAPGQGSREFQYTGNRQEGDE